MPQNIQFTRTLLDHLRSVEKVAVLTGAGISAESGVPTFRGENGLWKKYRPEELANFDAFMSNPSLVWEWYNYRRDLISGIQPNPGHYALAELEPMYRSFTLITQNVDGLHRLAGSKHILELHGNIMINRCISCGTVASDVQGPQDTDLPHCECGELLRPDVVWFGESLPERELRLAFDAAESCDVFFSIGTSGIVQPAASFPLVAKQNGAYVVEINVEETVLSSHMDETVFAPSGEVMPQLVRRLNEVRD